MSAVTQLKVRNTEDAVSTNADLATLSPIRVAPDEIQYRDLSEANLYDAVTATCALRQPAKPGGNHKASVRMKFPIGTAVTDDATGITSRKFIQCDISWIIPDDATETEASAAMLASNDLTRFEDETINIDMYSLVAARIMPY